MSEEVEVTFRFPRVHLKEASYSLTAEDYRELAMFALSATAIENLFYAQVLEWQETQKHVVTPDTPSGTSVLYTNPNGIEKPGILVMHRIGGKALIWFDSNGDYLLFVNLEDLRLAEGGGQ